MALTKYTYSITSDFPSAAVDGSRLNDEIEASSISTTLSRIDVAGDVCDIWFDDALSGGDKTTLDNDTTSPSGGLIGAHSGLELPIPTPMLYVGKIDEVTTINNTYELLPGMAITPGIGDFRVDFSASITHSNDDKYIYYAIFVDGVIVDYSEREQRQRDKNDNIIAHTQACIEGVTTGQVVDIRWNTNANTATAKQRSLIVTEV